MFVALAAYVPYLTLYYQSIGISVGQIGALMAFVSVVALVSATVWGTIHDRFPRSWVLLPLAGLVAAGGAFGLARSGPSPQLVVCAALFAIGMSGTLPMMDARVLEVTGSDRTRYGLVRACGSASFMVCAPLIGFLANSHGPASLFLIMVPALVIGGLAASAIPGRSQVLRAPSMLRAPGRVLSHRPIGFFLFGSLACWTAIYAQTGFFSLYLKSIGAPDDQVGLAWSLGSLGEIPTMIFFPVLAKRFGVERLIMLGAGLTVTRQIVNTVFTLPAVLLAFSLLHGAGYAMLLVGGVAFVAHHAPRGTGATAQGLFSGAMANLAAIIGSGAGGLLAGAITIRAMYGVSVGLGLVGIVLIAAAVLPASVRTTPAATAEQSAVVPGP